MTSRRYYNVPDDNTWKLLICRATKCIHNIEHKTLCGLEFGLEIDYTGQCIHYQSEALKALLRILLPARFGQSHDKAN